MPSTEPRGPRQIARAFKWSMMGLRAAWRHEASFRLEGYLFVILFPLGLWLGHGGIEKALLAGCLVLVLSGEVLVRFYQSDEYQRLRDSLSRTLPSVN